MKTLKATILEAFVPTNENLDKDAWFSLDKIIKKAKSEEKKLLKMMVDKFKVKASNIVGTNKEMLYNIEELIDFTNEIEKNDKKSEKISLDEKSLEIWPKSGYARIDTTNSITKYYFVYDKHKTDIEDFA